MKMGAWEIRHGSAHAARSYFRQLYEESLREQSDEAKALPEAGDTMRAIEA